MFFLKFTGQLQFIDLQTADDNSTNRLSILSGMKLKEKASYRITPARSGHPTLLVSRDGKEIPLHSTVDPMKEAAGMEGRFDPGRFDTLIVLGTGLGYHLLPLENMLSSYTSVFLIDMLDGLENALSNTAAGFLARDPKVKILSGHAPGEIAAILAGQVDLASTRGISVLEHPASMRLFPDYYLAVKKEIEALINKKAGNEATRKAFGVKYFRNILANIPMIAEFRPVSDLFGRFGSYPALVVTSGPSLDRGLERIRTYGSKCFVIAADSALPVLDRHGIRADFTVSIDPQPYIYEHLILSSPESTVPVLSLSASSWAFKWACGGMRKKDGMRFMSLNSHPLSQVIASLGGDMGSIESGTGNVAGDAVRMAMLLGFNNIALAGFDFSFPRYSIYARGTAYQRRYGAFFQDRFSTVESRNAGYIFTASGRTRKDGLYTRKSFIQYRESLEALISRGAGNIYTIGREGLDIGGATAAPEELFTGGPVLNDKSEIIMSLARKKSAARSSFEVSSLKKALENKKLFGELAAASAGDASGMKRIERMMLALRRAGA